MSNGIILLKCNIAEQNKLLLLKKKIKKQYVKTGTNHLHHVLIRILMLGTFFSIPPTKQGWSMTRKIAIKKI